MNKNDKYLFATVAALYCMVHCLSAAPFAVGMHLTESSDAELTAAVDRFVDHVADVTAAFCFDLYELRYGPLGERRLTVDEAVQLYDLVDIHVDASAIREVPMLELYDELNDLALECTREANDATLFQHTLLDLFVTGKGAPSTWQVFEVVLTSPPDRTAFHEYLAVHGATGVVYAIELGK